MLHFCRLCTGLFLKYQKLGYYSIITNFLTGKLVRAGDTSLRPYVAPVIVEVHMQLILTKGNKLFPKQEVKNTGWKLTTYLQQTRKNRQQPIRTRYLGHVTAL